MRLKIDNSTRNRYLQEIGIDQYSSKGTRAASAQSSSPVASANANVGVLIDSAEAAAVPELCRAILQAIARACGIKEDQIIAEGNVGKGICFGVAAPSAAWQIAPSIATLAKSVAAKRELWQLIRRVARDN